MYKITLISFILLISTACSVVDGNNQSISSLDVPLAISVVEETTICKLPGQVRRLAPGFTHLTAGRVIQTSQLNCITRGGQVLSAI